MAFFDFPNQLELVEGRVETVRDGAYSAGRTCRQVEDAATKRPAALIPFGRRPVGVAPSIAGAEGPTTRVLELPAVKSAYLGIEETEAA
jgi:hypothetical protein